MLYGDLMDFTRILLDYYETKALEHLLIRERYVTKYSSEFLVSQSFDKEIETAHSSRIHSKSKLLRTLLLFETIDSNKNNDYDMTALVDLGFIEPNSMIADVSVENSSSRALTQSFHELDRQLHCSMDLIRDIVTDIEKKLYALLKIHNLDGYLSPNIIENMTNDELSPSFFLTASQSKTYFGHIFLESIMPIIIKSINMINEHRKSHAKRLIPIGPVLINISKGIAQKIDRFYDNYTVIQIADLINLSNKALKYKGKNICRRCKYSSLLTSECAFWCEASIIRSVFLSDLYAATEMKVPIYSSSNRYLSPQNISLKDTIDRVYGLVNISLGESLQNLPTPSTFRELVNLRKRPELKSFRNIFSSWCKSLSDGDEETMRIITRDFLLAQKALKKRYHSSNKKSSLFYCTFKTFKDIAIMIAGLINPAIGIATSMPNIAAPWLERKSEEDRQKHDWFLLTN